MSRLDELLSEEFARWEQRGRGWKVWPGPVQPEPAFEEFTGYRVAHAQLEADDSRRPGFFASLFDSLEKRINPPPPAVQEETDEPEPNTSDEPLTAEFAAALPAKLDVSGDVFSAFLDGFQDRHDPTAFELLATHETITVQFAASPADAPTLERQLAAYFPKVPFIPSEHALTTAWNGNEGVGFIVDFGLAHECMLSLQTQHALDPFINLMSVLNTLQSEEVALFQVLFQPVQHPWPASVWRSVTDANGKALFVNRLDLIPGTKEKLEAPLFGAVVRAAVKASDFERAADLVRDMASALRAYSRRERNRLIPLHNDDYAFEEHETDLLNRQSRRGGLLLNRDELRVLVHLPSDAVNVPKLRRQRANSKAAPASVRSPAGVLLGRNVHAGQTTPVHLSAEQRTRHVHIIGASGSGKSTLLFNLIQQDIESGDGLAVFDPHGDLIDRILGIIPANRLDDVVLVDPSDEAYSVGFNILHAHSPLERTLLASDLVSVFRRLSTSWGDQMDAVLRNAILAFLHSSKPGTLADLRRFLIEKEYRAAFLQTVDDPEIVYYWQRGFPLLAGTKSVGPIITRLNDFLATPTIRCMVSQPESKLDFAGIIDTGKIFLAKLPSGLAGEKDCHLLGSLLVSKFQQVAMSRQAQQASARRDFWIYADEFDHFITPSMAEILKGTRKYRVGLTLAHHELHQLQREPDVASAVLSNASTRIVFRVGDEDARKLADGFASFEARDLQNLATGEAIVRVERSDADFNLVIPLPELPNPTVAAEVRNRAITVSRSKYAVPRAEVEARLRQQREVVAPEPPPEPSPTKARKQESPPPAPEATPAVVEPKVETPASPVVEAALVVEPPPPVETSPPVASKAASPLPPKIESAPVAETKPATQPETSPTVREISEPRDLGRGGEQHKNLQQRIQTAADKLGLQTAIESQIDQSSNEAADVTLKCGAMTMAVEITITTTTDHEFGNIRKCLTAGFHRVAVVSPKPAKLRDIEQAVKAGLDASEVAKVGYFKPDAFLAELEKLAAELKQSATPEAPKERVVHGYKVRRHGPSLSAEERQAKERIALRTIAAVLSEADAAAPRVKKPKS